jgi:hypothetical protein
MSYGCSFHRQPDFVCAAAAACAGRSPKISSTRFSPWSSLDACSDPIDGIIFINMAPCARLQDVISRDSNFIAAYLIQKSFDSIHKFAHAAADSSKAKLFYYRGYMQITERIF